MVDPRSLEGDGLSLAFFELLWSKNEDLEDNEERSKPSCVLRVPDTVVFLFGQPHTWYFTSKNGGPDKNKTTILRKRRANLTLANIEEVFLTKAGKKSDEDIVAYFVEKAEQNASSEAGSADVIEYFNKKALREFLQHGRHNKSGILQRFVAPHGGGKHNAQIRAIWTPRLCVTERRRTKQELHDKRFALYERAVTFDGPDVHSVSVPLRGTVLSGRIESICNEIVRHIADVAVDTRGSSSSSSSQAADDNAFHGVARAVINFKVDGNGKIWILWSNSVRLQTSPVDGTNVTEAQSQSSRQAALQHPLNLETVVKLPESAKLTQEPSHKRNAKLANKVASATCPSCNNRDTEASFQPVPYKTIVQHFEKTLQMLEEQADSNPTRVWPPEDRFIKAAGGVGFGALPLQLARDKEANPRRKFSEETHAIPPVLRQAHPKLRAQGYALYRSDPLFLLKTCNICEDCFLSYAELSSSSFIHVTRPVEPYASEEAVHYEFPASEEKKSSEGKREEKKTETEDTQSGGLDFGPAPELPPAIMQPPPTADPESIAEVSATTALKPKDSLFNALPAYFPNTDAASKKNLSHLLDLQKMLADATGSSNEPVDRNPYEENQKWIG